VITSQPRLNYAVARPADEHTDAGSMSSDTEHVSTGQSAARSDAPFLLTLGAVAAAEIAAVLAWLLAA
jgi:hypothetical protein